MQVREEVSLFGTDKKLHRGFIVKCFPILEQLLIDVVAKILVPKAANVDTSHLRCAKNLSKDHSECIWRSVHPPLYLA